MAPFAAKDPSLLCNVARRIKLAFKYKAHKNEIAISSTVNELDGPVSVFALKLFVKVVIAQCNFKLIIELLDSKTTLVLRDLSKV